MSSKLYDVFPSLRSLPFNTTTPSPSIRHLLPPALESIMLISYPIRQPSSSSIRQNSPTTPIKYRNLYGKGPADILFVLFCALTMTIGRELIMRYVFGTFTRWYLSRNTRGGEATTSTKGLKGKKERKRREHIVQRFSEQGWSFLYCTISWSLGAYILSLIPSPLSPEACWGTYPNTPIPQLTKFYYLAQLGWWFHQIYVINTEKRRHDHWQMFSHHILTIALVGGSYMGNFTRVGTVIHVLMDFCDILLPLAKMFRYLSFITLCDTTFVLFLISWLFTRQIGLAYMIYTSWVHAPQLITYRWNPPTEEYMSEAVLNGFIAMEILLLCLATMWFYTACMVAVRVLKGQGAEDVRSDGEDEGEEVEADIAQGVAGKGGKDLHVDLIDTGSGRNTPSLDSSYSTLASGRSGVETPNGVEAFTVGEDQDGGDDLGGRVKKGLQCDEGIPRKRK